MIEKVIAVGGIHMIDHPLILRMLFLTWNSKPEMKIIKFLAKILVQADEREIQLSTSYPQAQNLQIPTPFC